MAEPSAASEIFTRLWAAHDVKDKSFGAERLRHPRAGLLELGHETPTPPADPDQPLVVYTAEPGPRTALRLREPASGTTAG